MLLHIIREGAAVAVANTAAQKKKIRRRSKKRSRHNSRSEIGMGPCCGVLTMFADWSLSVRIASSQ